MPNAAVGNAGDLVGFLLPLSLDAGELQSGENGHFEGGQSV